MNLIYVIVLTLFHGLSAHSLNLQNPLTYYPQDFYESVASGERDEDLKGWLFAILDSAHLVKAGEHDQLAKSCHSKSRCYQHTALSYTDARKILFGQLHLEKVGNEYAIRDVYCQYLSRESEYESRPPGPGQIPDPKILNVEHTWPQSRFNPRFSKSMQKSDLHILFPALAAANSARSNFEFNTVVTTLHSPCPVQSRRGYSQSGDRQVYFEPPDDHKGNVARAIFYFAVRYQAAVSPSEEASLRAWHRADPADENERRRNDAIFAEQKVRNPFIDHPELVELIADF